MKSKRRRSRSRSRSPKTQAHPKARPAAAAQVHFTEAEEAFFLAGAVDISPPIPDSFDDLDDGYRRPPGLLRRLFSRTQVA